MQLSPRRKVFACYCSLSGHGKGVELENRQKMPTREEVEFPDGVNLCHYLTYAVLDIEIDGKPVVLRSEEPIEESPLYIRQGRIIGLDNISEADPATAMDLLTRIRERDDKTLKVIECEANIEDGMQGLATLMGIAQPTFVIPYEEGEVVVLNDVSGQPRERSRDRNGIGVGLGAILTGLGRRRRQRTPAGS